jgi:EAL and modified HD-GYP domain-containing signal transduction protein
MSTTTPPRIGLFRNVRVGRQGIYDAGRSLLAYEVLFRACEDRPDAEVAGERATSQVIASTFGTFGVDTIAGGKPVFINFTRAFLTGIIPIPVEPDRVVVEVEPTVELGTDLDAELVSGLGRLKDDGYRLALSGYRGEGDRDELLPLADYVIVDVLGAAPEALAATAYRIREQGCALMARRVEDEETYHRCTRLGFELYQGPLLQRPTVLERRTLSPSQLICVRLLNDLSEPDIPITRIEQLVGSDPGLTLRLLRTANSASAGATREITSLRQALVTIGPRRLRSWVVLTLLEGGTTTDASDRLWSVLARAFTCARLLPQGSGAADLGFTIGLLSGAAELLGVEPEVVADGSGIGQDARDALLKGDGEAGRALVAVLAHERDDEEGIVATGLLPFDVSRAYLESLGESLRLVSDNQA